MSPARLLLVALMLLPSTLAAQDDLRAYRLFSGGGTRQDFGGLRKETARTDVLLFGEQHDNPIAHWLQLELVKALFEDGHRLMLGMEMFGRHQQQALRAFLSRELSLEEFRQQSVLWTNFETDYLPLLRFARDKRIPVWGTNVPREYAQITYHHGLDSLYRLPDSVLRYMAPLPLKIDWQLPSYREMARMLEAHGDGHGQRAPATQGRATRGDTLSPAQRRFIAAQALKDATMAHSIDRHLPKNGIFIHLSGAFHARHNEGIHWYLSRYRSGVKVLTLRTVQQAQVDALEPANRSADDFLLVVPDSMTATH